MWFLTWFDAAGAHYCSPGMDEEQCDLILRWKSHAGMLCIRKINSGSFQPKDALPA